MYASHLIVDTLHKHRVETALRRYQYHAMTDTTRARTPLTHHLHRIAARFGVTGLANTAFGRLSPPVPAETVDGNADITSRIAPANSGD